MLETGRHSLSFLPRPSLRGWNDLTKRREGYGGEDTWRNFRLNLPAIVTRDSYYYYYFQVLFLFHVSYYARAISKFNRVSNNLNIDKFVRVKEEIVIIEFRSIFFFRYKRIFVSLRNLSFVQQNDSKREERRTLTLCLS